MAQVVLVPPRKRLKPTLATGSPVSNATRMAAMRSGERAACGIREVMASGG
jgi:hypothetical protein